MQIRALSLSLLAAATLVAACGDGGDDKTSSSSGSPNPSAPTPRDPEGPKDPSAVLDAAIILGSCLPDGSVNSYLQELYARRSPPDTEKFDFAGYTRCLHDKKGGCGALEACMGITLKLAPAPCAPATCDGAVLHACRDGLDILADCAKLDRACSAADTQCLPKTLGAACDYTTYMSTCTNGAPLTCADTEVKGPVCADYGLVCDKDSFDNVACVGTGPACTISSSSPLSVDFSYGVGCNSDKLRACINGAEQEVDCNTLAKGLTCQTSGMSSFCGLGAACDPTSKTDATCEGDSIVVCNAGRVDKVDCKSLGFKGCNANFGTCSPSIYDNLPP